MGKHLNLIGERFGRLVVISKSERTDKSGNSYWICKCDCGKEKEIRGRSLIKGDTKSCGCYQKEQVIKKHRIEFGLSSKKTIYDVYKNWAKKRNLLFDLSFEQFLELSQQPCYYCGIKSSNFYAGKGNGGFRYNGIDRLDNTKGYTIENCVPCCGRHNRMKMDLSFEDFANDIRKIAIHLKLFNREE